MTTSLVRTATATRERVERQDIKITNGSLAEFGDSLILRGVIWAPNLIDILVDSYQREDMERDDIFEALRDGGTVPDVELGMRGNKVSSKGDTYWLCNEVYVIDGLQRISAAKRVLELHPEVPLRIGATIHFNTTEEWEKARFEILNMKRAKVAPNIILRNRRDKSRSLLTIYGLGHTDKEFALYGRISWQQSRTRNELVTARTMVRSMAFLHAHISPIRANSLECLIKSLDNSAEKIGLSTLRANIKTFFSVIEDAFGIRSIAFRKSAPQIRETFMITLAKVFGDHLDFWAEPECRTLFVDPSLRRKLHTFPIRDPNIIELTGAGGNARNILYRLIIEHLDSGKRTHRLRRRGRREPQEVSESE